MRSSNTSVAAMTKPEAGPPGTPDDVDFSRIEGFEPADPIALLNRQVLRKRYLTITVFIWAFVVWLGLCGFVFTGSLLFLAIGYAVTVPFLVVCYQFRRLTMTVEELRLYCRMDGC